MRPFLLISSLATVLSLASCVTNPATGKSQFEMNNRDGEIKMGLDAAPQMVTQYGGEFKDAEINAYVTEIGLKLAATTEGENPKLPWKFTVLNSDIINAFALPGGQVFISRGLLAQMTNEAQMAGVLGHEVGHVTARHINDRMMDEQIASVGATIATSVLTEGVGGPVGQVAPQVVQLGQQSVVLRFGRAQELEADKLGMRYMSRLMYNPAAQRQVMEILQKSIGTTQGSEWFSTHPYPATRIKQIDGLLAKEYQAIANNNQYVFNPEQYAKRCRARLAAMADPDMPGRMPLMMADAGMVSSPVQWCAHCAALRSAR